MRARAFVLMTTAIIFGAFVAGSASGIDNCCFVDRHCHSDQDWVDGYWAFLNNQCSAPAPAQSQPTGPAPAQVDNCCFVDRQCHSDLDWMNGWRAYQAGLCSASAPASSQPPALAPSSPAGPAPAHVDNCCYVDRQCHSDSDWMSGWHAFQAGQCGAPGQAQIVASSQPGSRVVLRTASGIVIGHTGGGSILPTTEPYPWPALGDVWSTDSCCDFTWQCNSDQDRAEGLRFYQTNLPNVYCPLPHLISVVGDPDFVSYYEQRLALLRNRLPHRYNYVLYGLNKIEQIRIDGRGTHVSIVDRIYFVRWGGPGSGGRETRDAATLVKEACHVHAYDAENRFYRFNQEAYNRVEASCREMESAVLNELGARSM